MVGNPITYTLTITNSGNFTITNLLITDVVPANYIPGSGGTLVGSVVSWTVSSLSPDGAFTQTTFAVTATQSVINNQYRVSADAGVSATRPKAIVTIITEPGAGTSVFLPSQSLGNSNSQAVAVGDLDGDGFPDAFMANASPNLVWLNNGSGRFYDSGQTLDSRQSQAVALGDLDDDGDLDAFVGNAGSQTNQIWLNNGQGDFSTSGAPTLGNADTQAIALGDLNDDGFLDAFLGTNSGQDSQVWLNNGDGQFTQVTTQTFGTLDTQAVALGHLNGDNLLDVVLANGSGETNLIWLNNGDGTFTFNLALTGTQDSQAIALGHLNQDNDLDIFIANAGSEANQVWLNNGGGTFDAVPDQTLGSDDSQAVALGDLNNDGRLDAFVGNGSDQANQVWLNNGTGTFTISQALGSADSNAVALADLDLDGDLDIFVANGTPGDGQGNTIYLNQDVRTQQIENATGGILNFTEGLTLTLTIPPNALLDASTTFTYTPLAGPTPPLAPNLRYANRAFLLSVNGSITFNKPVTLTTFFDPTGVDSTTLRLYIRDESQSPAEWVDVATTCQPTPSQYFRSFDFLEVPICHLTEFALFDEQSDSNTYLPIILKNQ